MMPPAQSLRTRLLVAVVFPLLLVTLAVGTWRVVETNRMAADLFDRTLLSVALSITRDFGIRDGEALSPETVRLLTETSGGQIFYHVMGPDGSFVTGYATPPINPNPVLAAPGVSSDPNTLFFRAAIVEPPFALSNSTRM